MPELSRSQFPPGGWEFFQPQSKWSAPTPKSSTFDQTVILIIKHRQSNGAMTVKHRLPTDVAAVGNELENYTRMRLGIPLIGADLPKMMPPASVPAMSGAVRGVVAEVKKIAAGAALLMEWEESGLPPVVRELAETRAGICADCPKNEKGKSLSEWFTVPVADMARRRFQRLHELNLTTASDAELNVCTACLCPLKLKVHSPGELILKRLKPEQRAELNQSNPRCWILDLA